MKEGDALSTHWTFCKFYMTVDSIEPEQRIWVLMDFMGQRTRTVVTVDKLQLTN